MLVSCGRVLMFYDAHCRMSTAADAYDAAEGQIGARSGPGSALAAALAAGRQPNTAENANPVWTGALLTGAASRSRTSPTSPPWCAPAPNENVARDARAATGAACAATRAAAAPALRPIPLQFADGTAAFANGTTA